MKKLRAIAVIGVTATLALAGCSSQNFSDEEPAGETGPISIGAVLDITGPGATLGVPQQNTLRMLADALNAEGGIDGREVELHIVDNQSTEDAAARAVSDLIEQDDVDIILGASRTGPSLAMRPVAEQNGIPMISLAANAAIVADSEWVFKTTQDDKVVLERILDHAESEGYASVALLRDASGFGEGVAESITELGAERGIELVTTESFEPTATDFTAQLTNIRSSGADAVVIWGINPAAALAQKQYVQLGVGLPVYQSHGVANQSFFDQAGDAANGAIVPMGRMLVADQLPDDNPQKAVIEAYIEQYEAEYGEQPNAFGGYAYDAWNIAIAALEDAGTEPSALRDAIASTAGYVGVSGVFDYSPTLRSGLSADSVIIAEARDGSWVLIEE
ncbi:ABC transporter substrate-binding protein [Microbacterium sp. 2FI]|uniref:ABC transporter substrate-binding protein n=1 Tax=Microbacterium sp. 2FI TaxID=2502193 RepID=UPI0010F620D9|nr:ABC transporter substrate-binding protein [Microbacterium sp. 2FI]